MLLGAVAGAVGSVAGFVLVVSIALDGSGSGSGASAAVPLLLGILVGGLLAMLGFRRLGWAPLPAGLLGGVVATIGAMGPWVTAVAVGFLS